MHLVPPLLLALVLALLLPLDLGCCNARTVTQSGLLPFSEPDPPPTSHGAGELYVAGSGLTRFESTDGGSASSGGYVPVGQLHFGAMLRPRDGFMIRPMAMVAFHDGAQPLGDGTATPPPGTIGIGSATSARLVLPQGTSFSAGFDLGYMIGDESTIYLVHPHVGVRVAGISVAVSDPIGSTPHEHTGATPIVEGGLDLGAWVTPWLLLVGSADVRNMPAVASFVTACVEEQPPFLGFGSATLTMRISAEVEIVPGLGFFAGITFPVAGNPYVSYPILGGGLRGTFGDGRDGLVRHRPNRREDDDLREPTSR